MPGFKLKRVIQCMQDQVQRHLKSGGVKADGTAFGRNFAHNPTDIVKLVVSDSPSLSAAQVFLWETHFQLAKWQNSYPQIDIGF